MKPTALPPPACSSRRDRNSPPATCTRRRRQKGWGAAAQSVKAIAEAREWEHRNHAALFRAASQLAAETGDDDIHRWFHTASSLHVNFYEDWLDAHAVRVGLDDIDRLVRRLSRIA
ncbi:MAG: PaREP1 family protein [Chloroflexota bacterium]|nr:PaREP1 family protein [Chloroflexota bacterium]